MGLFVSPTKILPIVGDLLVVAVPSGWVATARD